MSTTLPWTTAWISGGSSGIGLEMARQLAEQGVRVAISARKPPAVPLPANVSFHALDVTDEAAAKACALAVAQSLGQIDLCIFGAGAYTPFDAAEVSLDEFSRINEVNYLGVLNCLAAVLPAMRARGRGHVSWIASVAGYRGLPKAAYYGPTKAALINLAECLKLELEPLGLKVSVINPGFVETPMTSVNRFKMPFLMQPDEAARRTLAGLRKGCFEVAYPAPFVLLLKMMRLLPYRLYFALAGRLRD